MEKLFELFKHFLIVHPRYSGRVCGFTEDNFLLAIESHDYTEGEEAPFFKDKRKEDTFILSKYRHYQFVYENETEILKQMKNADGKTQGATPIIDK